MVTRVMEMAARSVMLSNAEENYYYQERVEEIDNQQQAWGEVDSSMEDLENAAAGLTDAGSGFNSQSATSNNESVTAVAGDGAQEGSYSFHVDQLATNQQSEIDFGGTTPTDGVLTLTSNTGETMEIDMTEVSSTQDLADAINESASNFGVSASVVTDENGEEHLMVNSTETGEENGFSVSYTGADGTTNVAANTVAAQDAQVTIGGGITVTSSSNSMTNVIPGVTINLTAESVGQDVTVEVGANQEAITEDVNTFISAYNTMYDTFEDNIGEDGALFNNSSAELMADHLKDATHQSVNGMDLEDIGITTDENGHLTVDEEAFNAALEEDPEGVEALFTAISEDVTALASEYTKNGGMIDNAQSTLDKNEVNLQNDIADFNQQVQNDYERYVQEYSSMMMTMYTMQVTASMF